MQIGYVAGGEPTGALDAIEVVLAGLEPGSDWSLDAGLDGPGAEDIEPAAGAVDGSPKLCGALIDDDVGAGAIVDG